MSLAKVLRFITSHPLTADRKLGAIKRFATWQAASRIAAGPIAMPFVEDSRLLLRRGMAGGTGNVYVGLHEFEEMAFVLHCLRPEDLFVDVGANIGSYTVLAGKVAGARCVCLEPSPATFAQLTDNILINDLRAQVEAHQVAAGAEPGQVWLSNGFDAMNHVLPQAPESVGDAVAVPVAALDGVLGGRRATLMKIDVEGFEARALAGAAQTLAAPELKAVLMETNGSGARYGVSDDELDATMVRHGFSPYRYAPFSRALTALGPGPHFGNSLYLRDPEWACARVQAAEPFKVQGRLL